MAWNEAILGWLENRRASLFLLAGVLLAAFAANTAAATYLGQFSPLVQDIVAPTGFLVGVLGLLGLARAFSERSRLLALVAGGLAGITAAYWVVVLAGSVGDLVDGVPGGQEVFPLAFFFGVYLAMILTYGLFGTLSLVTGIHTRIVGLLVLGPAIAFLLLMLGAVPNVVIDAGHALFHLGLAGVLWTGDATGRVDPAPDSPA